MAGNEIALAASAIFLLYAVSRGLVTVYHNYGLKKILKEMLGEADGPIKRSDEAEAEFWRRRSEAVLSGDVLSYLSKYVRPETPDDRISELAHIFSTGMNDGFKLNYARARGAKNLEDYLSEPPPLTEAQNVIYKGGMRLGGIMAQHNAIGVAVLNLNEYEGTHPENLEQRLLLIMKEYQTLKAKNPAYTPL